MLKIKKGDLVEVIKGKDNGKKGKVLVVSPKEMRAIVEGINLVKKHMRRKREGEQGGIVSIEAPISISNLALFCKSCNRGVRVGFSILKDASKARFCKVCKQAI